MVCTIYIAKTKALICLFVFAYAKSRFSHDEAQDVMHVMNFFFINFLFYYQQDLLLLIVWKKWLAETDGRYHFQRLKPRAEAILTLKAKRCAMTIRAQILPSKPKQNNGAWIAQWLKHSLTTANPGPGVGMWQDSGRQSKIGGFPRVIRFRKCVYKSFELSV